MSSEAILSCSILLLVFGGLLLVFSKTIFGNIKYAFKGELNYKEFDVMLELIFNDPNAEWDRYVMRGGGYRVEHSCGYNGFKINEVDRFTHLQKIRFFKRMKEWKFANDPDRKRDRLHKSKLNQIIFERELEEKLESEK